jgi:hypothetical protein
MTIQHTRRHLLLIALIAVCLGVLPLPTASAAAPAGTYEDPSPIPLDAAGFGAIKEVSLAPNKIFAYYLDLKTGDTFVFDVHGDKSVDFSGLEEGGTYLPVVKMGHLHLHRALNDGKYVIYVQNFGDKPHGFALHVQVAPGHT